MEKMTYNVRTSFTGIRQVSGYVFLYSGLKFGVRKNGHFWQVSELSTGLLVTEAETRNGAIQRIFDKRRFSTVKSAVKEFGHGKDLNPGIHPKTEFLTVYA